MMRRGIITVAIGLALALGGAAPAQAAPISEVIEGEHLRLVSIADPATMRGMLPGEVAVWEVSISAEAPEPGTIDVALSGTGDLPLIVEVRACSQGWRGDLCAAGETSLRGASPLPIDGPAVPLMEMPADAAVHLRLDVAVPAGATPRQEATTVLRVHAGGYGDELEATPPGNDDGGTLPRTGMQLGGVGLLALGAVIAGIAGARLMASRRPEETAS